MEYKYSYVTLYDQECGFYGFNKHNMTNEHYYEWFNTYVDVGEAIGIELFHPQMGQFP